MNFTKSAHRDLTRVNPSLVLTCARLHFQYGAGNCKKVYCFSGIIFQDYLHYCEILLARFLITIVLNIISSLHIVFSLCSTEFTNLIKVDVDVDVTI